MEAEGGMGRSCRAPSMEETEWMGREAADVAEGIGGIACPSALVFVFVFVYVSVVSMNCCFSGAELHERRKRSTKLEKRPVLFERVSCPLCARRRGTLGVLFDVDVVDVDVDMFDGADVDDGRIFVDVENETVDLDVDDDVVVDASEIEGV